MSEPEKIVEETEVVVEEVKEPTVPDMDLSAVPEAAHDFVDSDKYLNDKEYQEAIEHGWKPKDMHEADGGDEADYTGYRQYNRNHRKREEAKNMHHELQDVKNTMNTVIDTFAEDRERGIKEAVSAKEAEFKRALEEGETGDAVRIQNEINDLKNTPPVQRPQGEPHVVMNFRRSNPMLDRGAPEFNASYEAAVIQQVNAQWSAASNNFQIQLPDITIQSFLEAAVTQVKKDFNMNTNKPRTQKAPRVSNPTNTKGPTNSAESLTGVRKDVYDRIKTKYGKERADAFAAKGRDE